MPLFDPLFREHVASSNQKLASNATVDEFENMSSRVSAWALVEHNEDGTHNVRPSGFDFVPIGGMMLWPGATAPAHWLICDGSQISRTTYQALFNIIGTTYGVGDGSTTYNLPDLRQRFPLGKAAAGTGSTLGSTGGAIDHTHTGGALTGSTAVGTTGTGTTGGGTTGTGTTGTGSTGTGTSGAGGAHHHDLVDGGFRAQTGVGLIEWSGTTADESAHTHSVPALSVPGLSVPGLSVPGLSVPGLSIPALGAGTLASSTSGANNPAYVSLNFIISTGV